MVPAPGLPLLSQVKAGFVLQNTSLTKWCRENTVHISNARNALIGTWNGPKGQALRCRIAKAAKVGELA